MPIDAIIVHAADNVATAVQELRAGRTAIVRLDRELNTITLKEDIPYGHKFTVKQVKRGEKVIKYGEVIGQATADIATGCHAHVQNIRKSPRTR